MQIRCLFNSQNFTWRGTTWITPKKLHPRASSAPGPHKSLELNAVMEWELYMGLGRRWVYAACGKNAKYLWSEGDSGSFKTWSSNDLTLHPSIWLCGCLTNRIQCRIKTLYQFLAPGLKEKKKSMIIVKDGRTMIIGTGTTAMEFCSWGDGAQQDWSQSVIHSVMSNSWQPHGL